MTDDQEIDAIQAAYACIKGLDRGQWTRVLKYLETRMAEDDRGAYTGLIGLPPPLQYVVGGHIDEPYPSAEEAMQEAGCELDIAEVNGIATVSQKFAVRVPCEDDEIIEWFDSRDAAETYLAEMRQR